MTADPEYSPMPRPVFPTGPPLKDPDAYRQLLASLSSTPEPLPCQEDPTTWTSDNVDDQALAASACLGCYGMGACRAYGLEQDEPAGVWGGTTPADRRRARPDLHPPRNTRPKEQR